VVKGDKSANSKTNPLSERQLRIKRTMDGHQPGRQNHPQPYFFPISCKLVPDVIVPSGLIASLQDQTLGSVSTNASNRFKLRALRG
jgi:hypothetical protein